MKTYKEDLLYFVKKLSFILFLGFLLVLSYGYSVFHPTVNIDTLCADVYIGSGQRMIQAGRFGTYFWCNFFGYNTRLIENASTIALMGVLMLGWAAINFCILFRRASKDTLSMPSYTVFAGFLVTYPLMSEIWGYQGANLMVCGGFLFVSFSLLLLYDQLNARKFSFAATALAAAMMTIMATSYESLVAVYIFGVFALLYLRERQEPNWKQHLCWGIAYCLLLVAAIALRLILTKVLLAAYGLDAQTVGETEIQWLENRPFQETLKNFLADVFCRHILYALLYYPLSAMLVCSLGLGCLALYQLLRKRFFASLLVAGMLFSVEVFSIMQGAAMYYRFCQVFAILCAFCAMLLANRLRWKQVVPALLCYVCLRQGAYLNYQFTLEDIRYQQEMEVVDTIAQDLAQSFDPGKEVVFVGDFPVSSYLKEQMTIYKRTDLGARVYLEIAPKVMSKYPRTMRYLNMYSFPTTAVNSVLDWSVKAHNTQQWMQELFAYRGYSIRTTTSFEEDLAFAEEYVHANETPAYPYGGYIVELEDLVIVNLALAEEKVVHNSLKPIQ